MIEAALRSALVSDATLKPLIGSRVYPGTAPDDAKRPYLVYRVVSQQSGSAENEMTCRFDVEVYPLNTIESPGYGTAVTIAKTVGRIGQSMLGQQTDGCIHSSSKPKTRDTLFRATNQHGRLVELFFRYTED